MAELVKQYFVGEIPATEKMFERESLEMIKQLKEVAEVSFDVRSFAEENDRIFVNIEDKGYVMFKHNGVFYFPLPCKVKIQKFQHELECKKEIISFLESL